VFSVHQNDVKINWSLSKYILIAFIYSFGNDMGRKQTLAIGFLKEALAIRCQKYPLPRQRRSDIVQPMMNPPPRKRQYTITEGAAARGHGGIHMSFVEILGAVILVMIGWAILAAPLGSIPRKSKPVPPPERPFAEDTWKIYEELHGKRHPMDNRPR